MGRTGIGFGARHFDGMPNILRLFTSGAGRLDGRPTKVAVLQFKWTISLPKIWPGSGETADLPAVLDVIPIACTSVNKDGWSPDFNCSPTRSAGICCHRALFHWRRLSWDCAGRSCGGRCWSDRWRSTTMANGKFASKSPPSPEPRSPPRRNCAMSPRRVVSQQPDAAKTTGRTDFVNRQDTTMTDPVADSLPNTGATTARPRSSGGRCQRRVR